MPLPEYDCKIPVDAIDGDWIKRGRDLHGIETRETERRARVPAEEWMIIHETTE